MIGSLGAQLGLLAFAVAIFAGLLAGNSAGTVLSRALMVLALAVLVGQMAAATIKLVLRDHLQRRKLAIDRQHLKEMETIRQPAPNSDAAPGETSRV